MCLLFIQYIYHTQTIYRMQAAKRLYSLMIANLYVNGAGKIRVRFGFQQPKRVERYD